MWFKKFSFERICFANHLFICIFTLYMGHCKERQRDNTNNYNDDDDYHEVDDNEDDICCVGKPLNNFCHQKFNMKILRNICRPINISFPHVSPYSIECDG